MQNMYIRVRAVAGAKKEVVTKTASDRYDICVRQQAERNMANVRIRELLAKEFHVAEGAVRLISGHHSPHKIFSVADSK